MNYYLSQLLHNLDALDLHFFTIENHGPDESQDTIFNHRTLKLKGIFVSKLLKIVRISVMSIFRNVLIFLTRLMSKNSFPSSDSLTIVPYTFPRTKVKISNFIHQFGTITFWTTNKYQMFTKKIDLGT